MIDTSASPQINARQSPQAEQDKTTKAVLTVSSIVITVIAVLLLLGLCIVELWVVPKFIEVFMDFDTQLPSITIFLIDIPAVMYLAIYGLGMAGLIAKEFIPPLDGGIKLGLNLLVIVLSLVMYIVYFLGLQLPMVQLMESLM